MEAAQQQAERMRHALKPGGGADEKARQPYIGELPLNENGDAPLYHERFPQ
jgi:hypothetical protein